MFVYRQNPLLISKRFTFAMLTILSAVLIVLSVGSPLPCRADGTAGRWTADMSGEICSPAGAGISHTKLGGVSARGAVLIEAESGDVIFGQNPNARLPMASTTKIMTALVALEKLPLETVVEITADSVGVEGSSIYLRAGEQVRLETLLYGLLLRSGNDAALAVAGHCGGTVEGFVARMNEKAQALGMTDSDWEDIMRREMKPSILELNLKAFRAGLNA